jgi:hypothetical protein
MPIKFVLNITQDFTETPLDFDGLKSYMEAEAARIAAEEEEAARIAAEEEAEAARVAAAAGAAIAAEEEEAARIAAEEEAAHMDDMKAAYIIQGYKSDGNLSIRIENNNIFNKINNNEFVVYIDSRLGKHYFGKCKLAMAWKDNIGGGPNTSYATTTYPAGLLGGGKRKSRKSRPKRKKSKMKRK